jgi:hypothetical protein
MVGLARSKDSVRCLVLFFAHRFWMSAPKRFRMALSWVQSEKMEWENFSASVRVSDSVSGRGMGKSTLLLRRQHLHGARPDDLFSKISVYK